LPLHLGAEVAVVLLVRTVKLEHRGRVLADVRGVSADLLRQDRLEILAGDLDRLDLARLAGAAAAAAGIAFTVRTATGFHHVRPPRLTLPCFQHRRPPAPRQRSVSA